MFTIDPRSYVTPDTKSPPKIKAKGVTHSRPRGDTASPEPSKNHQEPSESPASGDATPPQAQNDDETFTERDVIDSWNETATECGLPTVVKLTEARRAAIRARRREWPSIDYWKAAFRHLRQSDFLLGGGRNGWKADFDFFVQPKSFAKLVEGSYGQVN